MTFEKLNGKPLVGILVSYLQFSLTVSDDALRQLSMVGCILMR